MSYHEIKPGKALQPYVKCFFVYASASTQAFEDTVLPSGCTEIVFNLGSGHWQTITGEHFSNTPAIELWGQLVRPFPVRSVGSNTMLGVRFHPHGAAIILREKTDLFNNFVANGDEVLGNSIQLLHAQLQETPSWKRRLYLVEAFLLQQLSLAEKRLPRLTLIRNMMAELRQPYSSMETIAARYGITARYMQQLFLQNTGLTPKLYSQISRFQRSLQLVTANELSLTSIAYECGYADQSHFIKEFKAFTGSTPSGFSLSPSPLTQAASTYVPQPLLVV